MFFSCRQSRLLLLAVLFLLLFNGYYFFLRRNVGPSYYYNRLFSSPRDSILESSTYLMQREEYASLNSTHSGEGNIVFLGDSITRRFMLDEYFPEKRLLNRGIFSDTTKGCLERVDSNVNVLHPIMTFIMIGHNDLPYRENKLIVDSIRIIVDSIESGKKYLQSILPVYGDDIGSNRRIVSINNSLEEYCVHSSECIYVDLHHFFVDESGGMNNKFSLDGVHLNREGYDLWRSIILSKVNSKEKKL